MAISLKSVLTKSFSEADIKKVSELLHEIHLYKPLELSLIYINKIVKDFNKSRNQKYPSMEFIWSGLLLRMNECLKESCDMNNRISSREIVETCNYILTRSFEVTLDAVSDKGKIPLLLALKDTIYDTVNIFGIKQPIVENLMFLALWIEDSIRMVKKQSDQAEIPGLFWRRDGINSEAVFSRFTSYNICAQSQMKKIKLLFGQPGKRLNIKLNVANKKKVLLFFSYLFNSNIICSSSNYSVYSVLSFHVINFDGDFMMNKEVYKYIYNLKRTLEGQAFLSELELDFKTIINDEIN